MIRTPDLFRRRTKARFENFDDFYTQNLTADLLPHVENQKSYVVRQRALQELSIFCVSRSY